MDIFSCGCDLRILDVERAVVKKNIPEKTTGYLFQKESSNDYKISGFGFAVPDAAMTPQFVAISLIRVFHCF
jgi:hypothetical protein